MPAPSKSIAFCITGLEVGGAERVLAQLACRLDRARFAPRVVALAGPPRRNSMLFDQLRAAGVPVDFLGETSHWQAPRTLGRLTKWLRDERPEILQTFLWRANILGAIAAQRAKVPRVFAGLRVSEQGALRRLRVQRFFSGGVERHVCVSRGVARIAQRAGFVRERLVVIPNGIDVPDEPPPPVDWRELGLADNRRALLSVGRLAPQKGYDWLLEAMPPLFSRLPNHDLVIVGEGPSRVALERQSARLEIADRVHLVGWRADVPRLMAATDVFILPSRYEGMPNVVLEAMAAGKPVVASRVEGIEELLADDPRQAIPAEDIFALVEGVERFARDRALAAEVGRRNQEIVGEQFTIDAMVRAYEAIYE